METHLVNVCCRPLHNEILKLVAIVRDFPLDLHCTQLTQQLQTAESAAGNLRGLP